MATLSVLSYNLPPGLTMKASNSNSPTAASNNSGGSSGTNNLSKTFNKITVQNVLSENIGNSININNNNNVNTIVRKIKDFGMFGTVNSATGSTAVASSAAPIALTTRKRPLEETKVLPGAKPPTTPKTKKPKLNKDIATPKALNKSLDTAQLPKILVNVIGTPTKKMGGTPGRKGLPLPQAVARRNARERNRVKQVNNGFAALRDRIPEEVADAFEAQGNGRGTAKKLSKVETLRMAVEYIRSLERLLGFNFPIGGDCGLLGASGLSSSSGEDSFTIIKDEFDALSPGIDDQFDDSLSNYDVDEYFATPMNNNMVPECNLLEQQSQQLDLLPNITTLNGLQYIRIPGTNTYQLLTPDIFAGNSNSPPNSSIDDEPFTALIDTNCLSPAASPATTADLHSSPPSIIATANTAAPATPSTATSSRGTAGTSATVTTTAMQANGACVNGAAPSLSRSPVPQATSPNPTAGSSLHHQQRALAATLSPAANKLLLQTCAADRLSDDRQFVAPTPPLQQHHQQQQHLQPRLIKQEYAEADYASTAPSPTSTPSLIYQMAAHDQQQQQQQQQLLLGHATLSMSPPVDRCGSTALPAAAAAVGLFYEHDHNDSFYEGVVTFKKELNEVLLDTSAATAALSDESMIEAIDWWEAHTPKSDGGSVML